MGVDSFPPPLVASTMASSEGYRGLRARLTVLRVLLGITSLGAGAYVTIAVSALLIDDWSSGSGRRVGQIAVDVGCVVTLCCYASYVALAVWTGRAYRNVFALGVSGLHFTPGWGLGAWFVPFLNLVRPKRIVDDLWRSTTPGDRGPWAWPHPPVPATLHVWWALLLLTLFLAPQGDPDAPTRGIVGVGLVGAASMVASSGLGWWVTSGLTNRLESLAARRGHLDRPPRARRGVRGLLVVSGLAAVGLAAGAPLRGISTVAPTPVVELEVGDCFGGPAPSFPTPGEEVANVNVRACDTPHAYELIDIVVHDAPADATYPGEERLFQSGSEQCVAHFEAIVGTPFLQSELDVVVYAPTADSWRMGDREIQCAAMSIDGRPLVGTVVGSGQ